MRAIGDRIKELDIAAERAAAEQNDMLMSIPNMPHAACPVGLDETANPEVKIWGEKPAIDNPKDHVQIAAELGLVSFEDGTRITGSGFVVYRGCGARLERALINFLLDTQTQENGYQEVGVPFVVKRECMEGTGQLPKFEDDMYGTEEQQMFLIPTAEVPVTNLYRDTILSEDSLPVKMTAHTPCFRREAGSAGRDNRGMIRIHQFDKVELVQILKPEDSFAQLEQLLGHAESILQKLGLHYRVIELCTGDLGFSSAKTYDIEVWAPGQGKYLEVSSCSCFTDYQARRMRLRYKDANGKTSSATPSTAPAQRSPPVRRPARNVPAARRLRTHPRGSRTLLRCGKHPARLIHPDNCDDPHERIHHTHGPPFLGDEHLCHLRHGHHRRKALLLPPGKHQLRRLPARTLLPAPQRQVRRSPP